MAYDSKANNEKYKDWYNKDNQSEGILTESMKPVCKEDAGGAGTKKADPKDGCC